MVPASMVIKAISQERISEVRNVLLVILFRKTEQGQG